MYIMLIVVCLTVLTLVALWFIDYPLLSNSMFLKIIVVIILILSYILSITNFADDSQPNKSLPTMSLIINIIVTVLAFFANIKM